MDNSRHRTTVSLSKITKAKLDKWRANGQCYDGFLCQLVGLWEKTHAGSGRYEKGSFDRNNSVVLRDNH